MPLVRQILEIRMETSVQRLKSVGITYNPVVWLGVACLLACLPTVLLVLYVRSLWTEQPRKRPILKQDDKWPPSGTPEPSVEASPAPAAVVSREQLLAQAKELGIAPKQLRKPRKAAPKPQEAKQVRVKRPSKQASLGQIPKPQQTPRRSTKKRTP